MADTVTDTLAGDLANVTVGKGKVGGYFYAAPTGTALPTTASAALDSAYKRIGFVSEDGLTNSFDDSMEKEKVKDWTGKVIKEIMTSYEHTEEFSLSVIESNVEVFKQMFGSANVTTASNKTTIDNKGEIRPAQVFVFEVVLDSKAMRIIVPNGRVTAVGDVSYAPGDIVSYELTIEAMKDDTTGICSRRIIE